MSDHDQWLLTHAWAICKGGILSFCFCLMLAFICKTTKFNPNIWHIPINIIRFIIEVKRGKRYIVKICGTWRLIKGGFVSRSGYLHTKTVYPEEQEFCLENEFYKVAVNVSEKEVKDRVIALNVRDLQILNPLPKRLLPRGRPQDPFAEEVPQSNFDLYDPFEDALSNLSPEMRRRIARNLGLPEDE